ncbi:MAG: hypothetical protein J6Z27_00610 [Bacteroidales bacterium]|nr:hypothetical protein [Bacteroidales bacterium]
MAKVLILSIVVVAVAVVGLCFNIIFRKDGQFPDGEISHNKELRKRGVVCAKEEELKLWRKTHRGKNPTCADLGCGDCRVCTDVLK